MLTDNELSLFFKHWGFSISGERVFVDINKYDDMIDDARSRGGPTFVRFCRKVIDTSNGRLFLVTKTWDDLNTLYTKDNR